MISRTAVAASVGLIAAALIAFYVWAPFRAMDALAQAVKTKDRDALSLLVDFPSVRQNLKEGFAARIAAHAANTKALAKNPLMGLVLMVLPQLVNRIVDVLVTPDGIIALLEQPLGASPHESDRPKTKWSHSWHFEGLDHFKMEYAQATDPKIAFGLFFERRGLFSWKLTRLDLPEEELERRIGAGGKSGDETSDEKTADENTADEGAAAGALPAKVGDCRVTEVRKVSTRLQDADGTPVPGSGSAIEYANGGYQVSYDIVEGIEHAKAGDKVRLCLSEIPKHCPPGDNRGRIYNATDLRTREQWTAPDSEHSCGGA